MTDIQTAHEIDLSDALSDEALDREDGGRWGCNGGCAVCDIDRGSSPKVCYACANAGGEDPA